MPGHSTRPKTQGCPYFEQPIRSGFHARTVSRGRRVALYGCNVGTPSCVTERGSLAGDLASSASGAMSNRVSRCGWETADLEPRARVSLGIHRYGDRHRAAAPRPFCSACWAHFITVTSRSASYAADDAAGWRPDRIRVYQNVYSCAIRPHHHQFLVTYRLPAS